jgi:hypothetical protein
VSGQLHAPATLPPGMSARYPLYRRLGGPQSRSGRYGVVKIFFCPTGTRTPASPGRPARSQSLYRLSYPGSYIYIYIYREREREGGECSLYRLIKRPEHLIVRHCGISRQTEGNSFGDHLISESVSVTPTSIIEASLVLSPVSLYSCESMSNQPAL